MTPNFKPQNIKLVVPMPLIDSMNHSVRHLKTATKLACDWRVRNALADAGTLVECALFIQQKIASGELPAQECPPGETWRTNEPRKKD